MFSIVSTPIGNLDDITIRALKTLGEADVILCEDSRHTGGMLHKFSLRFPAYFTGKGAQLMQYHEHNEDKKVGEILTLLEQGKNVVLVSDAGTPLLSDPGYPLVCAGLKRLIPITVVPGASSALTALVASGLPPYPFTFLGYLPEKQGKRLSLLRLINDASIECTYICFISPHKVNGVLGDMHNVLGNIPLVIGRELTKTHEEFIRDNVQAIQASFAENAPKGELTVLFRLSATKRQ